MIKMIHKSQNESAIDVKGGQMSIDCSKNRILIKSIFKANFEGHVNRP